MEDTIDELFKIIRMLYRSTVVGDIRWEIDGGAFHTWIGDQRYSLKRESVVGLKTRDSLSVHSYGEESRELLAVSDHGAFVSWGLVKTDPNLTVSKRITTLFELVRDTTHRGMPL